MNQTILLRITEIFFSLQGETTSTGIPTAFIRLTGCPLRCQYCDSAYAFHGGEKMELAEILNQVASYRPRYVTVTGGEPLAQPNCMALLQALCDAGYRVSLETSGALPIKDVDARVIKIVDIKTPGSGEVQRNDLTNLQYLNPQDEVKFILCDRHDYEWTKSFLEEHKKALGSCEILFSPSFNQLALHDLAEWIIADHLPVRMQLQLHKVIWGDIPGK
jgi:7-carboxy-7-deazaguanine synthase